jgi:hypothetical protein
MRTLPRSSSTLADVLTPGGNLVDTTTDGIVTALPTTPPNLTTFIKKATVADTVDAAGNLIVVYAPVDDNGNPINEHNPNPQDNTVNADGNIVTPGGNIIDPYGNLVAY